MPAIVPATVVTESTPRADVVQRVVELSDGRLWRPVTRADVDPVVVRALDTGVLSGSMLLRRWVEVQAGWRQWCRIASTPCVVLHESERRFVISARPPLRWKLPDSALKSFRELLAPMHLFRKPPYVSPYLVQLTLGKPATAEAEPFTVARMLYDLMVEQIRRSI